MSFVKLNNFSESLEKLYSKSSLNESMELTEKFSETMPDWLAKRLVTTKFMGGYSDGANRDNADYRVVGWSNKKNPHFGPDSGHTKPNYNNTSKYGESLWNKFKEYGIELNKAVFEEGEVPTKASDPRLKDDYIIPIFLLDNNQVWAKGLNDKEKYWPIHENGTHDWQNSYNDKAFQHVPMKEILAHTKAFCTVSKFDNSDRLNKTKDREQEKRNLPTNYNRDIKVGNEYGGQNNRVYSNKLGRYGTFDKSGYLTIPPSEKYADKLREMKVSKVPDILDNVYKTLTDVKNDIAQIFMDSDIKGTSTDLDSVLTQRLIEDFKDIKNDYTHLLHRVENVLNDSNMSEEEKKSKLTEFVDAAIELQEDANKFVNAGSRIFGMDLDWI